MNPFTKFLSQPLRNRKLQQYIGHWDVVEAIAIRTYKAEGASVEDVAAYATSRAWLVQTHPSLENALVTHWQGTLAGGKTVVTDPFLRVLRAEKAADFVGDWEALQYLPAAREALNQLVLSQT